LNTETFAFSTHYSYESLWRLSGSHVRTRAVHRSELPRAKSGPSQMNPSVSYLIAACSPTPKGLTTLGKLNAILFRSAFYFQGQQLAIGDKMNLSSYLLKPVQRMGKYALILKQVLKECPPNAAEYDDLSEAEEMTRWCLQHGNDLLAMDALQVCTFFLLGDLAILFNRPFKPEAYWSGRS